MSDPPSISLLLSPMDCRPSKVKLTAVEMARAARWSKKQPVLPPEFIEISDSESNPDIECIGWMGGGVEFY